MYHTTQYIHGPCAAFTEKTGYIEGRDVIHETQQVSYSVVTGGVMGMSECLSRRERKKTGMKTGHIVYNRTHG